jgi:signal peptidase I
MRWRAAFAHFRAASFLLGGGVALLVMWVGVSFRLVRMTGDAMAPAYVSGDIVLVSALAYRDTRPRHGDVALLYYPLEPTKLLIDRVVATAGDTVQIFDGHVYVNDAPLADDTYVLTDYRSHDDWGPQVTPEGYDFVIGDHRNASSDSRHWGFVPRRYLWGKVVARMWPWR